jgi:O-antigen/teichoic acid export membrane protein
MAVKGKFFRGGLIVAGSSLLQQIVLFVRNLLLALALPPEQFGIALTLVTLISALEAVSELGIELFVVRSPDPPNDYLLNSLHFLLVCRGTLSAVLMFTFAEGFVWIFNTPEAVWVYRALALVPLTKGLLHLDLRKFERQQNYAPNSLAQLIAAFIGTVAAAAVAFAYHSYQAMLIAYLLQTVVYVALSHWFSESKYRVRIDRDLFSKLLPYSTPLILNGMLLFAITQGDRLLVGSRLGLVDLASYGVISIFTTGVTVLAAKLGLSLYLPILADQKPGHPDYDRRYLICGSLTSLMAAGSLIFFGVLAMPLAELAFGHRYEFAPLLLTFLGMQSAFKILRGWPQIGHLSTGATKLLLYSNMISCVGIVLAVFAVESGFGVVMVAGCMALGEITGAVFAMARTSPEAKSARRQGGVLVAGLVALSTVFVLGQHIGYWPTSFTALLVIAFVSLVLSYVVVSMICKDFSTALADISKTALRKFRP